MSFLWMPGFALIISNVACTNGWTVSDSRVLSRTYFDDIQGVRPILGADQNHSGVLTSPVISGGCGIVTVDYFRESATDSGSYFTLELKSSDGSTVFKSDQHVDNTLGAHERNKTNFTFNVAGDFVIVLTAHDITENTTADELGVLSVSWTSYSE